MVRKIAVSLTKGGTGRSSSSVFVAHGLARAGRRVLLVDNDDKGQDGVLLGIEADKGLTELVHNEATFDEAVVWARENLWLLSGGKLLSGIRREIGRKEFGGERTLSDALQPIEREFDYIIIDTSSSWDALTINSLFYAQEVLMPVSLEVLSLRNLAEFTQRLKAIERHNNEVSYKYVLPTFLDGRVKKSQEVLTLLKKYYEGKVCAPIRYNVRISEAPGFGKTIFEYAPRSPAAADYQKITKKILSDEWESNL